MWTRTTQPGREPNDKNGKIPVTRSRGYNSVCSTAEFYSSVVDCLSFRLNGDLGSGVTARTRKLSGDCVSSISQWLLCELYGSVVIVWALLNAQQWMCELYSSVVTACALQWWLHARRWMLLVTAWVLQLSGDCLISIQRWLRELCGKLSGDCMRPTAQWCVRGVFSSELTACALLNALWLLHALCWILSGDCVRSAECSVQTARALRLGSECVYSIVKWWLYELYSSVVTEWTL